MTSRFWIPIVIYHSYHWPYSIWYYWPQSPIWKKKTNQLPSFSPLTYSILMWILSFCPFSAFLFWFILLLLSVRHGQPLQLRALWAVSWHRVQQAFHASRVRLLFLFSNTPTLIWALIIFTGPPASSSRCTFLKTLLCLWQSPEQQPPASSIPINNQMKYKPALVSPFPYSWSYSLHSSLDALFSFFFHPPIILFLISALQKLLPFY